MNTDDLAHALAHHLQTKGIPASVAPPLGLRAERYRILRVDTPDGPKHIALIHPNKVAIRTERSTYDADYADPELIDKILAAIPLVWSPPE